VERIPLETQTLYAELLDQLQVYEAQRSIGHLQGGFTRKTTPSGTYCYFQYSAPGGMRRQIYVGKESPAIAELIRNWKNQQEVVQADLQTIQRLCAQLRVGGALVTSHAHARVLRALADSGVFRMGGVLVGTHAFAALGNQLGVRWEKAGLMTQDVDIATERDLDLALPDQPYIDLPETLKRLKMGFLPVPALDPRQPSTSFKVRKSTLTVDVLTPARRRSEEYRAVKLAQFGTQGQALLYLDYLIENPQPAAIINSGGILVNVPDPARYALHKLIVTQRRPAAEQTKGHKDLRQAQLLLELLVEERPGDLRIAWEQLVKRGPSWMGQFRKGLNRLLDTAPSLRQALGFMLSAC